MADANFSDNDRRARALEAPLRQRFDALGIEVETYRHEALHTVAQSRTLRGSMSGGHIKNLFLRDKKRTKWLVTVGEDRQVDLKILRQALNTSGNLSFGSPQLLRETLGVEPGSVTPFAVMNDAAGEVTFVMDHGLMRYCLVNAHPLHNEATVAIRLADLLRFLEDCEHKPLMVEFAADSCRIVPYEPPET